MEAEMENEMKRLKAGVILANVVSIVLIAERIWRRHCSKELAERIAKEFGDRETAKAEKSTEGVANNPLSNTRPSDIAAAAVKETEEEAQRRMEEGVRNILSYEPPTGGLKIRVPVGEMGE